MLDKAHQLQEVKCCIQVGHDHAGHLCSVTRFADGEPIIATADDPDLGLNEPHTVLHDAVHLVLCLMAMGRVSPVLERVAGIRPGAKADPENGLDQELVDLEEAAAFAIHAYVAALQERAEAGHEVRSL